MNIYVGNISRTATEQDLKEEADPFFEGKGGYPGRAVRPFLFMGMSFHEPRPSAAPNQRASEVSVRCHRRPGASFALLFLSILSDRDRPGSGLDIRTVGD
jgi:hypothetical protein